MGDFLQKCRRGSEFIAARIPVLKTAYWNYAPAYYRWRIKQKMQAQMPFDAPLDPLKIVWVDPNEITKMSGRDNITRDRWRDIGLIKPGDWDIRPPLDKSGEKSKNLQEVFFSDRIEKTVLYSSFEKHYEEHTPWEDTKLFISIINAVNDGIVWKGASTRSEVMEKLEEIDELAVQIKEEGYKSQLCLHSGDETKQGRIGYLDILTDEITVDIGRDGDLLFVDGRHRICLAKLLDVEYIPIFILTRHEEWIENREIYYSENNHKSHPDIVEFSTT